MVRLLAGLFKVTHVVVCPQFKYGNLHWHLITYGCALAVQPWPSNAI